MKHITLNKLLIKLKLFLDGIESVFYKSLSNLVLAKQQIWLIGERPDTAQDNGYYFFKHLQQNHKNVLAYYIIDKKSQQFRNAIMRENYVQYNSFKHKLLFSGCLYYVSSHNKYGFPNHSFSKRKFKIKKDTRNIFLQHGITYNDNSDNYGKEKSQIDLFICGAKPEYEFVKEKFGYEPNQVKLTGFARFDGLHNIKVSKQILLMPTWRKKIWKMRLEKNEQYFINSTYYKTLQSLVNNDHLSMILKKYDYNFIFYPHYEIQPYLKHFTTNSENIIIASKDFYNVQKLLKESALLITDYSSVTFDFAYMYKPIIYYLFDWDDFTKNHLIPGYFNYRRHGFGKVVDTEVELLKQLELALENNCVMLDRYKNRVIDFFPLYDTNNCERIYQEIIKIQ